MIDITNFQPKKILVLQQRQIGDVIVSTPIFSLLRKKYPKAHIALFTEDKCLPLVLHDPNIDSFEIVRKQGKVGFFEHWKLYLGILWKRYDLVVSMQQLPRCQMATFFSFAKVRLSFYPRHFYRKFLYNVYSAEQNYIGYVGDARTSILAPLGIEATFEKPCLYLTQEEKKHGQDILNSVGITVNTPDATQTTQETLGTQHGAGTGTGTPEGTQGTGTHKQQGRKFITLDATHKHDKNRWAHYKELVECILEAYPEFCIFLLRAPGEEGQLQEILKINPTKVLMPEKALSLRESMACMSYASFHIGNTSAPAHMSVAFNVPTLVILARTNSEWHCPPKDQYKGRARQLELRLKEGIWENYLENIAKNNQDMGENKEADLHAALNLISPAMAMEKFKELVKNPYY